MAKLGARTKFTPDRVERLLQGIRVGSTYELACKFAGISYSAFRSWMRDAEQKGEESEYFEFHAQVEEAEGAAAMRWLGSVEKAAKVDWRAAVWKLERRYPDDYGRKAVEFTGRVDTNLSVEAAAGKLLQDKLAALSDDELDALSDED